MGLVQGITEFLPVSSSGHLIIVPALLGWNDPFIDSLEFSVMLHMGTLVALLVYFWRDWLVLVPAFFAAIRDRSLAGDPLRRLAWLLAVTTIPAIVVGVLFNDLIETHVRQPGLVAVLLVVGAIILWVADRWGSQSRSMESLTFPEAFGIGAAQALALFPGISRSGISISAGRFLGLDRESAARFSFLMAAPIIAGAGGWETLKVVRGQGGASVEVVPLVVGLVTAMVAGLAAIHFLLRWLNRHPLDLFVAYRLVLAAIVVVWFLHP
ncbi:MAG TPA: undecaprenyl-diphosphatase UppP [Candidatus Dormibacteraeota bacterium]|nr:undecaprenyl-diphosphatase UppP [Candidatus Dormibacteraeota bacterium]